MEYNVYENIKCYTFIVVILLIFPIYLLHCASDLLTPVNFLFVNEKIKFG